MSAYDFNDFVIEKVVSSSPAAYQEIDVASFTFTHTYDRDDRGTLLIGPDTGALTLSWHTEPVNYPIRVGDRIRVRYGAMELFLMVCDSVSLTKKATPLWESKGVGSTTNFSARFLGTWYAAFASTEISLGPDLPEESWTDRLARYGLVLEGE